MTIATLVSPRIQNLPATLSDKTLSDKKGQNLHCRSEEFEVLCCVAEPCSDLQGTGELPVKGRDRPMDSQSALDDHQLCTQERPQEVNRTQAMAAETLLVGWIVTKK